MTKLTFNPHLQNNVILSDDNIVVNRLLNSSSSPNMNVDGSSTPVIFSAAPSAGKYWMIARVMLYFSDGTAFDEAQFGALSALTNGVSVMANNVEIINWKDNMDVQTTMFDADGKASYTKLDRSISGRWSFTRMGTRHGLQIDDETNGFAFKIQDNLTGLTQFRARIQGIEYDKVT